MVQKLAHRLCRFEKETEIWLVKLPSKCNLHSESAVSWYRLFAFGHTLYLYSLEFLLSLLFLYIICYCCAGRFCELLTPLTDLLKELVLNRLSFWLFNKLVLDAPAQVLLLKPVLQTENVTTESTLCNSPLSTNTWLGAKLAIFYRVFDYVLWYDWVLKFWRA